MSSSAGKTAILLVGHGTKMPGPDELLTRLATEVRRRIGLDIVETAYCELQPPDLQTGIDRCLAAGAKRIVLYPCFLLAGKHVTQDLPNEVARAIKRCPGVDFRLTEPLGSEPELGRLVSASLVATLVQLGWKPTPDQFETPLDRK
jgi:sirohydrochlorin ferrochelatase